MSKKIHSQDSNFRQIWSEMDDIDPLTPTPAQREVEREDSLAAYREAAASDAFLFGDYDAYAAYMRED